MGVIMFGYKWILCGSFCTVATFGFAVVAVVQPVTTPVYEQPQVYVQPQVYEQPQYVVQPPQQQMLPPGGYVPQPPVVTPPVVNYFRPQYNQFDPNYSAWQSYQLLMLPDQRLTDRVRNNIARDSYLAGLLPSIQIYSSGGIVTLAGAVPSSSVRTKIEVLAKQTNGVYRVDNQLVLIRPARPGPTPRPPRAVVIPQQATTPPY